MEVVEPGANPERAASDHRVGRPGAGDWTDLERRVHRGVASPVPTEIQCRRWVYRQLVPGQLSRSVWLELPRLQLAVHQGEDVRVAIAGDVAGADRRPLARRCDPA